MYLDTFVKDLRYFARVWLSVLTRDDKKAELITNFVARGDACLESVYVLCKMGNHHDGQILSRTMVDLIVHMKYVLIDGDRLDDFWGLSIKQRLRFVSAALRDNTVLDDEIEETEETRKILQGMWQHFRAERKRMGKDWKWENPEPGKVLSGNKNYERIYRHGYDVASSLLVHPVFSTGQLDYSVLTGREEVDMTASYLVAMNAAMVQALLMHMGAGFWNKKAGGIAREVLVAMVKCLQSESYEYQDQVVSFQQRVATGQRRWGRG